MYRPAIWQSFKSRLQHSIPIEKEKNRVQELFVFPSFHHSAIFTLHAGMELGYEMLTEFLFTTCKILPSFEVSDNSFAIGLQQRASMIRLKFSDHGITSGNVRAHYHFLFPSQSSSFSIWWVDVLQWIAKIPVLSPSLKPFKILWSMFPLFLPTRATFPLLWIYIAPGVYFIIFEEGWVHGINRYLNWGFLNAH